MGTLLVILLLVTSCLADGGESGEKHEDSRCLCKCPDVSTVKDGDDKAFEKVLSQDLRQIDMGQNGLVGTDGGRSIYLNASVGPQQCDCQHVVLIHLNLTDHEKDSFCPRCSCKFQIRSLTVMKVVVIVVIWVISILVIYMGFLQCLDPILNNRRGVGASSAVASRAGVGYREHRDEEGASEGEGEGEGSGGAGGGTVPMQAVGGEHRGDVINRLGNQQTKWKRQVQEQRRNIYDTHRMLN